MCLQKKITPLYTYYQLSLLGLNKEQNHIANYSFCTNFIKLDSTLAEVAIWKTRSVGVANLEDKTEKL